MCGGVTWLAELGPCEGCDENELEGEHELFDTLVKIVLDEWEFAFSTGYFRIYFVYLGYMLTILD